MILWDYDRYVREMPTTQATENKGNTSTFPQQIMCLTSVLPITTFKISLLPSRGLERSFLGNMGIPKAWPEDAIRVFLIKGPAICFSVAPIEHMLTNPFLNTGKKPGIIKALRKSSNENGGDQMT